MTSNIGGSSNEGGRKKKRANRVRRRLFIRIGMFIALITFVTFAVSFKAMYYIIGGTWKPDQGMKVFAAIFTMYIFLVTSFAVCWCLTWWRCSHCCDGLLIEPAYVEQPLLSPDGTERIHMDSQEDSDDDDF